MKEEKDITEIVGMIVLTISSIVLAIIFFGIMFWLHYVLGWASLAIAGIMIGGSILEL